MKSIILSKVYNWFDLIKICRTVILSSEIGFHMLHPTVSSCKIIRLEAEFGHVSLAPPQYICYIKLAYQYILMELGNMVNVMLMYYYLHVIFVWVRFNDYFIFSGGDYLNKCLYVNLPLCGIVEPSWWTQSSTLDWWGKLSGCASCEISIYSTKWR